MWRVQHNSQKQTDCKDERASTGKNYLHTGLFICQTTTLANNSAVNNVFGVAFCSQALIHGLCVTHNSSLSNR